MESLPVESAAVLMVGKERIVPVPQVPVLWVPMGRRAVGKAHVCVDSVSVTQ